MFGRNTPNLVGESFSLAANSSMFITWHTRIQFHSRVSTRRDEMFTLFNSHYSLILFSQYLRRGLECVFGTSVCYNPKYFCFLYCQIIVLFSILIWIISQTCLLVVHIVSKRLSALSSRVWVYFQADCLLLEVAKEKVANCTTSLQ